MQRHFWTLADRVDDDVYDFLDRILTCVIILLPEGEIQRKTQRSGRKVMWLTPRTRRRGKRKVEGGEGKEEEETGGGKRRQAIHVPQGPPLEIKSVRGVTFKEKQGLERGRFLEGLRDPPDIRYHRDDEDDSEDSSLGIEEEYWNEAKSSSGSSSTLSEDEDGERRLGWARSTRIIVAEGTGAREPGSFATVAWGEEGKEKVVEKLQSKYFIGGETMQQRNERLKKSNYGILGLEPPPPTLIETQPPPPPPPSQLEEEEGGLVVHEVLGRVRRELEEVDVSVSTTHIKHISARKWKHERDHPHYDKKKEKEEKKIRFTEGEIKLMRRVDKEASKHAVQAVHSKSMEAIRGESRMEREGEEGTEGVIKRALSLQSIRHLLESSASFQVGVDRGEIVAISKEKKDALKIEGKLQNENEDLLYISFGKVLIVDNGVRLSTSKQLKGREVGQKFAAGLAD